MKRILIVDDEKYFRKALIVSTDWAGVGFEVCGEAENGIDALEKTKELTPDVVLSDINMSKMDGLEFIRRLREVKPDIKVIVISGYNDFDYAKRSLNLGVCDYIVKPVDPEELARSLQTVSNIIDRERGIHNRLKSLRSNLDTALGVLKAQYISKILSGSVPSDEKELHALLADNEICLTQPPFLALAIDILPSHTKEWTLADKKLWTYALENIAHELLAEKYPCETSMEKIGRVSAILCYDGNDEQLRQILESLCYLVEKHLDFAVAVGIGKPRAKLQDVHGSATEAVFAIKSRLLSDVESGICFYSDVSVTDFLSNRVTVSDKNDLLMQMRLGNSDTCLDILHKLKESQIDSHASLQAVHVTLVELLSIFLEFASENAENLEESFPQLYTSFFNEIITSYDINALFLQAEQIMTQLLDKVQQQRSRQVSAVVQKALTFIHENYGNEQLTVEQIAQETFTSYGYLCHLFKKDMKQTLNDYLTGYRMEQARNLLVEGKLSISQVAERVGFSNSSYFSRTFKKYFDKLPSDLRPKT